MKKQILATLTGFSLLSVNGMAQSAAANKADTLITNASTTATNVFGQVGNAIIVAGAIFILSTIAVNFFFKKEAGNKTTSSILRTIMIAVLFIAAINFLQSNQTAAIGQALGRLLQWAGTTLTQGL